MAASLAIVFLLVVADGAEGGTAVPGIRAPDVIPGERIVENVLRVVEASPFQVWVGENPKYRSLWLSQTSDKSLRAQRSIWLDGPPSQVLDHIDIERMGVSVAPMDGIGEGFFLVKLYDEKPENAHPVEHMQYLIRRIKGKRPARQALTVVCKFPGGTTIRIRKRSPLVFTIVPGETASDAGALAIEYGMVPAGVLPGFPSCGIRSPQYHEGASPFEYEATRALADMLFAKGEWDRAGRTRHGLLRMRPHARDAEDVAIQAIKELWSFFDGGCTFEPPGFSPVAIPQHLDPLFRAYDDYLVMFPEGKAAADILYSKAFWLAGCRHHREAAELFESIGQRFPEHKRVESATRRGKISREDAEKQAPP